MKKRIGIACMSLGLALVLGAGLLLFHNRQQDVRAREFARGVLPELRQTAYETGEGAPEEAVLPLLSQTPVEVLTPEELAMTEKVIDGHSYVASLFVPDLGLELPVMSGWDYNLLQISPCRYTGTVRGKDLVIMAHNYPSHFGRFSELQPGARVRLVDMDGNQWNYEVVAMDVLAAEDVAEMTAGAYDLTLFTCAANRTHRVTIRCNLVDV